MRHSILDHKKNILNDKIIFLCILVKIADECDKYLQ